MKNTPKFGLVLSGGGAKGAYHVGALKYLSEIGFSPEVIAGTSIGALNGAILAASKLSFDDSVVKLGKIWNQLGKEEVVKLNKGALFNSSSFSKWLDFFLLDNGFLSKDYILDTSLLEKILKQHVSIEDIKSGIDFWIAVFPVLAIPKFNLQTIFNLVISKFTLNTEYFRLNEVNDEKDFYNLLLASAAIPLAFPSRRVKSQVYVDGGLGDNVPLIALKKSNCTHVIVIHLQHGSVWNRNNFEDERLSIIEIRPEEPVSNANTLFSNNAALLDFSSKKISSLINHGYYDARRVIEPIIKSIKITSDLKDSTEKLLTTTKRLKNDKL